MSRIGEHKVELGQRKPTNSFAGLIKADAGFMLLQIFAKY
jgi:hypothetical protein